jgi:uncharacterized protein with WD repeat
MDNYYIYKNSDCKKNVKVFNLHENIVIVKEFKNSKSFIDEFTNINKVLIFSKVE